MLFNGYIICINRNSSITLIALEITLIDNVQIVLIQINYKMSSCKDFYLYDNQTCCSYRASVPYEFSLERKLSLKRQLPMLT